MRLARILLQAAFISVLAWQASLDAGEQPPKGLTSEQRGYWFLTEKTYLPPDFSQDIFDNVWKKWPEPFRTQAEKVTPEERRKMAFSRYGLTPRPDDPTKPLQYVVDAAGNWTMNCFACHGGKIEGKAWPGLPNSHFALATLTDETRALKIQLSKPLGRMDFGSIFVPLGATNGTTNAVNFGVALMAFRDKDLNFHDDRLPPKMVHHDMDAPPWWHFAKKKQLYIDGFAEKGHRGLMQFTMVRSNGPEKFKEWEADYRDVYAYISSLRPPKYPHPIDQGLAARGETAFRRVCAECHGTYGKDASYPELLVGIEDIKTDRTRLDALTPKHRDSYGQSWFAEHGAKKNINDPGGFVAPPLDGVWASAPYFHNGSVPTLWQVLRPKERPVVWRREENGYDQERGGLKAEAFATLPKDATADWQKRTFFDTRAFGKSAAGHDFPQQLTDDEARAVLEYLKTL
ncbi:MAG: cytochrome c [Pirellulaceae bacterium]